MSTTEISWEERKRALAAKKEYLEKTNPLYRAIEKFHKVQSKYRHLGASDTEPRCVFYNILRKHLRGEEVTFLPHTEKPVGDVFPAIEHNMWELYSSVSGWKRAHNALTTACKKVLKAADKATLKQVRECDEWFGNLLD